MNANEWNINIIGTSNEILLLLSQILMWKYANISVMLSEL